MSEQAAPNMAKSALRIDGAMTAGGPMFVACLFDNDFVMTKIRRSAEHLEATGYTSGPGSALERAQFFCCCFCLWVAASPRYTDRGKVWYTSS